MPKLIDETGNRYGEITVVRRSSTDKQGKTTWICECDCGNITIDRGSNLRGGSTNSCGCKRNRLPKGVAAFNRTYFNYVGGAKKRGLSWELNKGTFGILTQENCYYCGVEPTNSINRGNFNGDYIYNGIDRIDNNEGYTVENSVPCCFDCNRAKMKKSCEEFITWVIRVYDHLRL